jgi:SulP family sulfate permease
VVASIIIFVVRYSSQQPVRAQSDGGSVHSGRDRPIPDERLLDHHDERIVILQLQGFIFFGTAYTLYRQVRELIDDADHRPSHLVLDMRLVQGMDSSAASTFAKMARATGEHGVALVMVPGSAAITRTLEQAELTTTEHADVHLFEAFAEAIEWCEEQVLDGAREELKMRGRADSDDALLDAVFNDMMAALDVQEAFEDVVRELGDRLELVEHAVGSVLFTQGDQHDRLYFIVNGVVAVEREDFRGEAVRLRTLGRWNIVGELGAYLGYREPFGAKVERAGDIRSLSKEVIDAVAGDEPELSARLQGLIIELMGSKLAKATQGDARS